MLSLVCVKFLMSTCFSRLLWLNHLHECNFYDENSSKKFSGSGFYSNPGSRLVADLWIELVTVLETVVPSLQMLI